LYILCVAFVGNEKISQLLENCVEISTQVNVIYFYLLYKLTIICHLLRMSWTNSTNILMTYLNIIFGFFPKEHNWILIVFVKLGDNIDVPSIL